MAAAPQTAVLFGTRVSPGGLSALASTERAGTHADFETRSAESELFIRGGGMVASGIFCFTFPIPDDLRKPHC